MLSRRHSRIHGSDVGTHGRQAGKGTIVSHDCPDRKPSISIDRHAPGRCRSRWLARAIVVALAVAVLGPGAVVGGAQPALAYGYADLNEESWSKTDAAGNLYTLTARIAIETDGSVGRLRFRLQCFRTDHVTGRRAVNGCDFHFAAGSTAFWCNSQVPNRTGTPPAVCAGRNLDDRTGSDVVWVGTWHSLAHQVELVHVHGFSAVFNSGAGPAGVAHSITSANAIAKLANQQAANGYAEWGTNCNYYSMYWGRPCEEWCADFLQFVWKIAGVAHIGDITPAAASLKSYGQKHGTWHPGSSLSGIQPGDAVSYGVEDPADNNHVAIYVGGGQVVSGNSTNNDVRKHSATYRTPSGYTRPVI
jgi:hypothetical protein